MRTIQHIYTLHAHVVPARIVHAAAEHVYGARLGQCGAYIHVVMETSKWRRLSHRAACMQAMDPPTVSSVKVSHVLTRVEMRSSFALKGHRS